jgi:SAM-dependent methyltransferase
MPRTDPLAWKRLCESPGGQGYVFVRGIELALARITATARPGGRWLDVGCGTGRLLHALTVSSIPAIGVDANPAMLDLAKSILPGPPPLVVAVAEHLPFADAAFDGAAATSFMGCVADPRPMLAELGRVVRPDGCLVVTCTNAGSALLRLNYAVRRGRPGGHHLYRVDEACGLLAEAGFTVEDVRFYSVVLTLGGLLVPPAPVARRIERTGPSGTAARLARNFIITARRASG